MRLGLGLGLTMQRGGGLASYALGGVLPSLVADAPRGFYYGAGAVGSSFTDIGTFARAGSANALGADGKWASVATNVPRVSHDPLGGPVGLALEEASTNLAIGQASAANWTSLAGGAVVTDVTGGVQIASNGAFWHGVHPMTSTSLTGGVPVYFQANVAPGTSGRVLFNFRNITDDLQSLITGLFSAPSISSTAAGTLSLTRHPQPDGSTLLRVVFTPASTSNYQFRIGPDSSTAGETILAYWAQAELGGFSSPILGSTAGLGRAADAAQIAMAGGEFTVVLDTTLTHVPTAGFKRLFEASIGASADDRHSIFINNSGEVRAQSFVGGVARGTGITTTTPPSGRLRLAVAFGDSQIRASLNGAAVVAETGYSGSAPAVDVARLIDGLSNGAPPGLNLLHVARIFPGILPDAALVEGASA